MIYARSNTCGICGKDFWGIPDTHCGPCEAIIRSWVAKGFLDLCRYLEKVTAFEAHCLKLKSSYDPAPRDNARSSSEGELDTHEHP